MSSSDLASSGVHSNGFSLVRERLLRSMASLGGAGTLRTGFACTRAACLPPHGIYVKPLLAAIRAHPGAIKALAHITGGGFPENIPRILPATLGCDIDLAAIPVPPVFGWLSGAGGVAPEEMLRTFNCGIGMIVVVGCCAVADVDSAALRRSAGRGTCRSSGCRRVRRG